MALLDQQNKVIYWDEVNWQWLPFVVIRVVKSKAYFLLKHKNASVSVNSKEEVVSYLLNEGYTLSPISNLGITEIAMGTCLYEGRIYKRDKGVTLKNLSRLLTLISGMSLDYVSNRLKGLGVITDKNQVRLLTYGKGAIEFKGKVYSSQSELAKEFGFSTAHISRKLSKGLTLEEIILEYNSKCVDHLGNSYHLLGDMLAYWGVHRKTYNDRLKRGWTLEEALTGKRGSK